MDLNQVTFHDDLQFIKNLADKVKKANSMLGVIHHSFQYIDNEMLIYISTMLRSTRGVCVKCVVTIQSPRHKADRSPEKSNKTVKRPLE